MLEDRSLPSSTLYLDFGDNFPASGFEVTDGTLGANLSAGGLSGPSLSYASSTLLRFQPASTRVTFDYNGSGGVNSQDWIDLRASVFSLVQRYYEPFDVNVVLAPTLDNTSSATYLAGVQAALNAGPAVNGERDTWCFAVYGTVASSGSSIGGDGGFYGIASGRDIGGNNANDDSCYVAADIVFNNFGNAAADTAFGYTCAHEPAHNFGLAHVSNSSVLAGSDVIVGSAAQSSSNRNSFDFFTRFPLTLDGGGTVTNYDRYANTSVLGLRTGAPAYITGTGAHDIITITRQSATVANVTVRAFSNATYTTAITVPGSSPASTTYSYTVPLGSAGLFVDGGFNNDRIIIDATIGVPVTVRGMGSVDQLWVNGGGAASATYTQNATAPVGLDSNASYGGTLTVGATIINFSEFETTSSIEVSGVTTLTVITPNANDVLGVSTVTGGRFQVTGTSGGLTLIPVLADVTNLIVDAGANDGEATPNDIVNVSLGGVLTAGRSATVDTGAGVDLITISTLAASTTAIINAGTGDDTVSVGALGGGSGVDLILGSISVNGQGGTDFLTFEDGGDSTGDIVSANATQVGLPGDTFFGAGGALTYSQIATVTFNLGSGPEIITLTPSTDTTFNVNANAPTVSAADRLTLNLDSVTTPVRTPGASTNGIWTFGNRQAVTYTGVEDQLVAAAPDVIIGDGTGQRSRITQLRVVFDHIVQYGQNGPLGAFVLERMANGVPVGSVTFTVNTAVVGDHTEATINFTSDTTGGSLNDGRYRLTVLANQISVQGASLAANATSSFHRLFGDINGDERVNIADYGLFSTSYGKSVGDAGYLDAFDFNGDGRVNIADYGQFAGRYGVTLGP